MQSDQQPPDQYYSEAFIKSLHGQVVQMKEDLADCRADTKRNTESIERVEKNTSDIVEAFQAVTGGLKVMQGLARFAKYFSYVAGAVAAGLAAWSAIRGIMK